MTEEVKLFAFIGSVFVCRAEIALKLKGVDFQLVQQEDLYSNKSPELLKYNPVHKKVPVLLHNGKPIVESLVIVEYVDEMWKGYSILPEDPYDKAVARFWAKFFDDKCIPAFKKTFFSKGQEQEKAVEEATELLKILENELKGKKFFGGDNIGLVDIAANFISYWLPILEEITGLELLTKEKFPNLTEWVEDFVNCSVVKESLPPKDGLVALFRAWLGVA